MKRKSKLIQTKFKTNFDLERKLFGCVFIWNPYNVKEKHILPKIIETVRQRKNTNIFEYKNKFLKNSFRKYKKDRYERAVCKIKKR